MGKLLSYFILHNRRMEIDESTRVRALEAVKRKRVVKFKFVPSGITVWCVYSRKRDKMYLVIPDLFCSCTGFLMNVILTEKKKYCYHMVAQKIAEKEGMFEEVILGDEDYLDFIKKLIKYVLVV